MFKKFLDEPEIYILLNLQVYVYIYVYVIARQDTNLLCQLNVCGRRFFFDEFETEDELHPLSLI